MKKKETRLLFIESLCIHQKNEIQFLKRTLKELGKQIIILESNCDIPDYQAQKLYAIIEKAGVSL